MTILEALERVKTIEDMRDDPESARSYEDDLYEDFVRFVADKNKGKLGEIAKLILETKKMDFPRWCA